MYKAEWPDTDEPPDPLGGFPPCMIGARVDRATRAFPPLTLAGEPHADSYPAAFRCRPALVCRLLFLLHDHADAVGTPPPAAAAPLLRGTPAGTRHTAYPRAVRGQHAPPTAIPPEGSAVGTSSYL